MDKSSFSFPEPPTEAEATEAALERHGRVAPFSIENWPHGIRALSIQTAQHRLSTKDTDQLVGVIGATMDAPHDPWSHPYAITLAGLCELMIAKVGGKAFVRLGSRSPKDNPVAMDGRCRPIPVYTGRQAVEFLCYSERVLEDLLMAKRVGVNPVICLRRWLDIDGEQEFRCFVEDGLFAGATQYYLDDGYSSWINQNAHTIGWVLRDFALHVVRPLFGASSFTCDIILTRDMRPTLLELNPPVSLGMTFPGLFKPGSMDDFDGDFRFVKTLPQASADGGSTQ